MSHVLPPTVWLPGRQSTGSRTTSRMRRSSSLPAAGLPRAASGAAASRLEGDALTGWFRDRGVETWLSRRPFNLLRVSAQLYNGIAQVHRLTELTLQALHEPSAAH